MSVLHVLLLRHGLTDANASGTIQGHSPTPLNETGRRQAVLLAAAVAGWVPAVEVLVSSDLLRARQTAEPVASTCGVEPVFDAAWRERGLGKMEGKTFADRDIWRAATGEHDTPGAEPSGAFRSRVRMALLDLPRRFPDQNVIAVVTHGGPVRSLLHMLYDGSLNLAEGHARPEVAEIANCSILHLTTQRTRRVNGSELTWSIGCVNDVRHLADLVSQNNAG